MDAESEPFQREEKSQLLFPFFAQLNLSARQLFHYPGSGLPHRAFLLAQVCDQFLQGLLVRLDFVAQIGKETLEWFPFVGVNQAIEQFERADRAREVVVQITAQVFHTVFALPPFRVSLAAAEGSFPFNMMSALKTSRNPK